MPETGTKRGEEHKVDHDRLLTSTMQKIIYLSSKGNLNEKEVYHTVKSFFKELLILDYEFTHDELIDELHKTYLDKESFKQVSSFLDSIGRMEYSHETFTQQELLVLLEEMRKIVRKLIHHHRQKSFFEKIIIKLGIKTEEDLEKKPFERIDEEIIKEEEEIDEQIATQHVIEILTEIEKSRDEKASKKLYAQATQEYEKLEKHDQERIYPELQKAYHHIIKK